MMNEIKEFQLSSYEKHEFPDTEGKIFYWVDFEVIGHRKEDFHVMWHSENTKRSDRGRVADIVRFDEDKFCVPKNKKLYLRIEALVDREKDIYIDEIRDDGSPGMRLGPIRILNDDPDREIRKGLINAVIYYKEESQIK